MVCGRSIASSAIACLTEEGPPDMKRLDDIYRDSPDAAAFSRAYLDVLADTLRRLDARAVARFIEMLLEERSSTPHPARSAPKKP